MEDIIMLSGRLDHLEERMLKMEEKANQLDKNIAVYSAMSEKNVEIQGKLSIAIDKLSDTTSELRSTLIGVQRDIKANSDAHEKNDVRIGKVEETTSLRLKTIEDRFEVSAKGIEGKIKAVDEKGKFDILIFIQKNFVYMVFALYTILEFVKDRLP